MLLALLPEICLLQSNSPGGSALAVGAANVDSAVSAPTTLAPTRQIPANLFETARKEFSQPHPSFCARTLVLNDHPVKIGEDS